MVGATIGEGQAHPVRYGWEEPTQEGTVRDGYPPPCRRVTTTWGFQMTGSAESWPERLRTNSTESPWATASISTWKETGVEKSGRISAQPGGRPYLLPLCRMRALKCAHFGRWGPCELSRNRQRAVRGRIKGSGDIRLCAGCIQIRPIVAMPGAGPPPSYPPAVPPHCVKAVAFEGLLILPLVGSLGGTETAERGVSLRIAGQHSATAEGLRFPSPSTVPAYLI